MRSRASPTITAVFLGSLASLVAAPAWARDDLPQGYCRDGIRAGWNFYCDPPPQEVDEQAQRAAAPAPSSSPVPETPRELSYTEQIEQFRREMDELKYRAVLDPTPENVQAYMAAQQDMGRMATAFTDQWQRVLFRTPSLDINTRFPMSQMGGAVYQDQIRVARENSLRDAAANLGFMVIVEDAARCGLCTPQLEVVARMQANFGIEVIVISADGAFHPLFPNAQVDTGQLRALGLADSPRPTIALVEPRSGLVEPIGSGLLTEDVILERVHVVTQIPAGERY
ncbi:conjugal transfer protein TraF [Paenirhodobacter populi]|uniref:Conjugal transfer protein TraF n=1 Tax=Paenirhodobacter populi TaxID=2306993 RepID=A0A443JR07_9RHOB|nr:conjugal transfer protein TraF [Sinirhodobacter populi]RWR22948.1 conjugal transfer protein TraF [Sinirhodobacter populi]